MDSVTRGKMLGGGEKQRVQIRIQTERFSP